MKCLIVEDDLASRRVLKDLLMLSFDDCDIAVNGQEAIDSFLFAHESKRPYDVIFMDIMMPVVNGLEALKVIRSHENEMGIPPGLEVMVVMTSALDDPRTVIESFNCGGATSYIVKPITRQKLAKEVAAIKLAASNRNFL